MIKARIYKPSKNAMQSGRALGNQWYLEYESTSPRRPEHLMGWISSEDTLNQVRLKFSTMEEAVRFAQEQKFDYSVLLPHQRRIEPKNYLDNFKQKTTRKTTKAKA